MVEGYTSGGGEPGCLLDTGTGLPDADEFEAEGFGRSFLDDDSERSEPPADFNAFRV